MPELSFQNIDLISNDVRKQEITFRHLPDELIDHICCDVEYEMRSGLNFHEAYNKVKEKMGKRRLKEIQEETLYAVDTKYRKMKNTMKISAIAGTVLLGFATLFKIMHWPGAGIMIVLGGLALAFIFMPSALVVLWKETHNRKRLFLYISAFLAGMFFIMGTVIKIQHYPGAAIFLTLAAFSSLLFIPALLVRKLRDQESRSKRIIYILGATGLICYILGLFFKIQHWPGAGILLMGGIIVIFFVVFPWYTWISWKKDNNISSRFLFMVIGSLALVIPSALFSLNQQRNYDAGYYFHLTEQQAMYNYLSDKNHQFVSDNTNSAEVNVLQGIEEKTNVLIGMVNGIEKDMVAGSEGKSGVPVDVDRQIVATKNGIDIQFHLLKSPFNPVPFRDYLQQGTASRINLDKALKEYADFVSGLVPGDELQKAGKLLDPSVYFPVTDPEDDPVSLMSALHMTALLKNSILTVEAIAFSEAGKNQSFNK